jgi:hypothetical protein
VALFNLNKIGHSKIRDLEWETKGIRTEFKRRTCDGKRFVVMTSCEFDSGSAELLYIILILFDIVLDIELTSIDSPVWRSRISAQMRLEKRMSIITFTVIRKRNEIVKKCKQCKVCALSSQHRSAFLNLPHLSYISSLISHPSTTCDWIVGFFTLVRTESEEQSVTQNDTASWMAMERRASSFIGIRGYSVASHAFISVLDERTKSDVVNSRKHQFSQFTRSFTFRWTNIDRTTIFYLSEF